jgi:HlyD family secretion protein
MTRINERRICREAVGLAALALFLGGCAHNDEAHRMESIEGTLECDEVDVSAKVSGRLTQVLPEEGSPVRAGDVVARLESKEIDAKVAQAAGAYEAAAAKREQAAQALKLQKLTVESQIRQAEAAYGAAGARLEMALNGARPQEIRQAEKALEQAVAADQTASSSYQRFHGLFAEGVISAQAEEEVRLRYLSAKAQREAAEARLDVIREGARKEEVEQARQGVAAAEAALKMARDAELQNRIREQDLSAAAHQAEAVKGQLDEARSYQAETSIVSPVDGYVSEKMFDAGEMVAAGSPILTLVRKSDFKVKVYADETKFGYLQLDRPVRVKIPALAGAEFEGRIIRIAQAADFATRKATNEMNSVDVRALQIVVRLTQEDVRLRTGMTARVQLPVMEK